MDYSYSVHMMASDTEECLTSAFQAPPGHFDIQVCEGGWSVRESE